MELLSPWVYAREGRDPYFDRQQHLELVREFLTLDEETVVAMRRHRGQP